VLAVTALGAAVLWGVADYSKGQRDLISLQADCAKAEAAGAIGACDVLVEDEEHTALINAAHSASRQVQEDKKGLTADQQKSFDAQAACRVELTKAMTWVDASKRERNATLALCAKLVH
jgi:hypothetical protein